LPALDSSEVPRQIQELQEIGSNPLDILKWAMVEFEGRLAMSTSFGIQSAILLHLATQVKPDIPIVWVDTGYLPAETYHYAETLRETLNLNLHVATNTQWTPARMEAIHGKLWESDEPSAHGLYGKMRKVEPMQGALNALEPNPMVLLSGLRAAQTKARANMKPISFTQGRFKLLPLLKMSDEDVAEYFDRHDLPRHPLESQGYVTVGDWHSSRPVEEGEDPRNTRFGGKFQECGLHVDDHEDEAKSAAEAHKTEVETVELTIEPESLRETGVKALGLTQANNETDMAVIIVKKLTEDGSFCRKCIDVANKVQTDNVEKWIGHTAVANVLDPTSEGAVLAKHFNVVTAPFFLVRDLETQQKKGEWTVVRSYLQLRKMLEKAADHKIEAASHTPADLQTDHVYRQAQRKIEESAFQLEKLQLELREAMAALESAKARADERKHELGL
jgi:phosphoadenosine phosphosulfate reductase